MASKDQMSSSQNADSADGLSHVVDDSRASFSCPIAIVGQSCRFSGDATDSLGFWNLCANGASAWSPIPKDRFNSLSLYHPDGQRTGRHHVQGGHFFKEDVGLFDAPFFNLSADVARAMDPQLRLVFESVYESLENAGIPIASIAGSNTSVFSGIFARDYFDTIISDPEQLPASFITGNGSAMYSNRVSHFFDLQGASMTIDTGCSTSMAALHQSVRNLQLRESDVSIVTSASALLNPDMFIVMSSQNVLSAEGRCFAWDARATGYGRGEGVASLILKRLDDAHRNGDHIHAVIVESGLNQDGKTTTISSPSMEAQKKLIEETYKKAGLDPAETPYIEAHMTGTPTGDPIEAEALALTFGKRRSANDPVLVGSCKPNIGHTEPVSGLAAIIRATHILRTGLIPPNINYKTTNINIPLKEWNLKVPTSLMSWPSNTSKRISINNFGYGGTNAHVIMEAASPELNTKSGKSTIESAEPARPNGTDGIRKRCVFFVSSKDSDVTVSASRRLAKYLRASMHKDRAPDMVDLAHTLTDRRSRFQWSVAVHAGDINELVDRLEAPSLKPVKAMRTIPRLGFVFNGQGAQWHAMGRELIQAYPVFETSIVKADHLLRAEYGATWSLHEELLKDSNTTRVHETELAQPVSVAIQICLVDLLASWGIVPTAVTSHSSGEIAAAYTFSAVTFKEALGIAYWRGALALKYQKLSPRAGGMLAVGLSVEEANKYLAKILKGKIVVACINGPESVTLSGDLTAIDEIAEILDSDGIFVRRLKVPLAYHSHHMQDMAQEYHERLSEILIAEQGWIDGKFTSPVTGGVIDAPKILNAEHWVKNLTSPVLFSQSFEAMFFDSSSTVNSDSSLDIIIEVGAHSTLAGPIRSILKGQSPAYISCLIRSVDAVETMQDVACQLLVRGYPVSCCAVNQPQSNRSPAYIHDIPTYAWNHSTRYWTEPRTYHDHRLRKSAPHELLGTTTSASSGRTLTWRNFLRLRDIPWLTEHTLEGRPVLPGAAYITMAIDAVRLVDDTSPNAVLGYHLRDVNILNALEIPDTAQGVEISLSLHRVGDRELDHNGWFDFDVSSINTEGMWVIHCSGGVSIDAQRLAETSIHSTNRRDWSPPLDFSSPGDAIDPQTIYAGMRSMQIYHGPGFQNIVDCHASGTNAVTSISLARLDFGTSSTTEYVVHPATLDAVLQSFYVCVPDDLKVNSMVIPRSIRSMYVSDQLPRTDGQVIRAHTTLIDAASRGATSNGTVVHDTADGDDIPVIRMQGFYCHAVPRADAQEEVQKSRLCAKLGWELDVLRSVPEKLKASWRLNLDDASASFMKRLKRVSYLYICEAVDLLQGVPQEGWQSFHKTFYSWMQSMVELGEAGMHGPGSQSWHKSSEGIRRRLVDDLAAENACGALVCRVGPRLSDIIQGRITALELMIEDGLLNKYYMESPALERSYQQLGSLSELFGTKVPGARVLEVGAGTGGATAVVLERFKTKAEKGSGTLLGHYDFTDVSAGFFDAARQKFMQYGEMMDFKLLDIEKDPATQGFTMGSYDLVVASIVLHATKSLERTVRHVRKLLKPGGKLFLLEHHKDRLDLHLIFGNLPGWWLSEEPERKYSPNAAVSTWDAVLKATGFSGVDFSISDCEEEEFASQVVMVSTAEGDAVFPKTVSIIVGSDTPTQSWLDLLSDQIRGTIGSTICVEQLDEVQVKEDRTYLVVAEHGSPLLAHMDTRTFDQVRALVMRSQAVLWLCSGDGLSAADPLSAEIQGVLRVARQEDSTKRCILLELDHCSDTWSLEHIPHIIQVLQQSLDFSIDPCDLDSEFAVKDELLHVPRFYPDPELDQRCISRQTEPTFSSQDYLESGQDLVWETNRSGTLSDIHFAELHIDRQALPESMLEIDAEAFSLNFRDVLVALGQLDETFIGHDVAGVVKRLGAGAKQAGFRVGDRVCGLAKGRFATTSHAHWTNFARIPDDMSLQHAACLPIAYTTAYISLLHLAGLKKGESILIHAATGGVGQAAIMIAQHVGADIFVTCGNPTKRDLLIEKYGLDANRIFSSRDTSFAVAIKNATSGKGIDVILNSLAGPMLKATWDCIAPFGRFIEIGKTDLEAARVVDLSPFARSASFIGFDILQFAEHKAEAFHECLSKVIAQCSTKDLRPASPTTTLPMSEMEKGLRQMQAGTHVGKLVLAPQAGDRVTVRRVPLPLQLDDSEKSYLITGGLGGIGRAISRWFIDHGAKHLIVTSRKADSHPDAASLRKYAEERFCHLKIIDCDISDEGSVRDMLTEVSIDMPPVRGIIQGAMQLDDTVLERMTHKQWQRAVLPKVAGTLNLEQAMPDLDFYILLSSIAGVVGNVSQANYAAGGAFQDAFARARTNKGLPAVSIDLGPVASAGYVAEGDESLRDRIQRTFGSSFISVEDVLALIETAIRDPIKSSPELSQIVTTLADFDSIAEEASVKKDRRFKTLRLGSRPTIDAKAAASRRGGSQGIIDTLAGASTKAEAAEIGGIALMEKVAALFDIPITEVEPALPLSSYGVDSLSAVELRNWLNTALKAKVTIFEILQGSSIREFAELVVSRSSLVAAV